MPSRSTRPPAPPLPAGADDTRDIAARWLRVVRSLDPCVRAAYMRSELAAAAVETSADALDRICTRAEQAEAPARELLLAIIDALGRPEIAEVVERLREEAAGRSLLALARLLRRPFAPTAVEAAFAPTGGGDARALTLGERKALARRPTRASMDRLLADPHPDVIRALLDNPRLTESDVIRLAARRPGVAPVLWEIARSARWSHRPRVRMALVLNPASPPELAIPLLALLVRHELAMVAGSASLPTAVRAAAAERLARRPPFGAPPEGGVIH